MEYTHQGLEEEVRSISGSYTLIGEERLHYKGRNILNVIGLSIMDTSCCGVGGCRFINVPGYIVSWKKKKNDSGMAVSEVEPITYEKEQKEIKKLLELKYPNSQINF